jgi:hypothetical protein
MAGLVLARKERKQVLREEAIERNTAYQEQISTIEGIKQYIHKELPYRLGSKQLGKLERKLHKLENNKK